MFAIHFVAEYYQFECVQFLFRDNVSKKQLSNDCDKHLANNK